MNELIFDPQQTVHLFSDGSAVSAYIDSDVPASTAPWVATIPALHPEWLGGRRFTQAHGVRYPYVVGAMANGIASTELVAACAAENILAFFGAAGLDVPTIDRAIATLRSTVGVAPFGVNLIHAPHEPHVENATADLIVRHGVTHVSASAYMKLTPAIVHVAYAGARIEAGQVVRPRHIFAKISRPEVARHFMQPAPQSIIETLVADGRLTPAEAEVAASEPVAHDIIVESDSGGHTDNQSLGSLYPRIDDLRRELKAVNTIRLGAAGGIGSPRAVAAAFGYGADFVVTGSVNQAAVESGLSAQGKAALSKCDFGDVMMAPAADMFEMGVEVQVLKRGTMFGVRAHKLRETYLKFDSWADVDTATRDHIEQRILGATFEEIWNQCVAFFTERDPRQIARASEDPRHQMALVFRWYLGKSSRWAIEGAPDRALDYQIWCGPAMASFNSWAKGTPLEPVENRRVADITHRMMGEAAWIVRQNQLRLYGVV